MLGWLRQSWQGFLQRMVRERQLQQEADVFQMYICARYYASDETEAEAKIPDYDHQKAYVQKITEAQVTKLLRNLNTHHSAYARGATRKEVGLPYLLRDGVSTAPNAGHGTCCFF
jgi:hypothetical protein